MNFKHLYYFWATANAGGVMRAAEQLHTTPQTISGQIKLLEARLGTSLFRKTGRRLELTDEGRAALEDSKVAIERHENWVKQRLTAADQRAIATLMGKIYRSDD